jgi:hypothetical protein
MNQEHREATAVIVIIDLDATGIDTLPNLGG